MLKQALFSTLIALAVVIFATQAVASTTYQGIDPWGGAWEVEDQMIGQPTIAFTDTGGWNSSRYNPDDIFSNVDVHPGYMTANGNPGGLLQRQFTYASTDSADYLQNPPAVPDVSGNGGETLKKSEGWTVETRINMMTPNFPIGTASRPGTAEYLQISDDANLISIRIRRPAEAGDPDGPWHVGITPEAGGDFDANNNTIGSYGEVDWRVGDKVNGKVFHTLRLVRQPGSDVINLYINDEVKEDGTGAASATVIGCSLPWCDDGNARHLYFAPSAIESAVDYFRYHRGASAPQHIPEPATLGLLGLGGVALLRRRR